MSILAVSCHLALRWETVKNMDKSYLKETLPALVPRELEGLEYIGADEVAHAKGHDSMTAVYDLVSGQLILVGTDRTSAMFSAFLHQLTETTALGIKAVTINKGSGLYASAGEVDQYIRNLRDEWA